MASTGQVIGFGFLAVAIAAGGGYYLYDRAQQRDQDKIGQSFADLSQCLAGKPITADGEIVVEVSTLEGRLAHRPAELRTLSDGAKWPSACAPHARVIYDIVHASSKFDRDAKGKLLAELEAVEKAASAEDPAGAALPGKAASLWRAMEESGIAMAKQSSSPTPPAIQRSDVTGDLPFAQLLPLDGGPVPQFLIEMPRKKDPDAPDAGPPDRWGRADDAEGRVSLCTFADGTLTCKKLPGVEVYTPVGRWASADFVPLGVDGELGIFDGKKITRLGIQAPLTQDVYVDEKGTVFALDCSGARGACLAERSSLFVKTIDGAAKRKDLVTAIEPLEEELGAVGDVALYGHALYFAGNPASRAPLSADGKVAAGTLEKLGLALDSLPRMTCNTDGMTVGSREQGPVFFTAKAAIGATGGAQLRCYAGGFVSTRKLELCDAEGCSLAVPEDMQKRLPDNAVVGRVGDRNALLWSAKGAKGVLLQLAGADPKKLEPEIVLSEKSVDRQYLAIIGTRDGALVFWEHEKAPRGVFVAPDGKVAPIKISM